MAAAYAESMAYSRCAIDGTRARSNGSQPASRSVESLNTLCSVSRLAQSLLSHGQSAIAASLQTPRTRLDRLLKNNLAPSCPTANN
jgi:hypothetical protein